MGWLKFIGKVCMNSYGGGGFLNREYTCLVVEILSGGQGR